MYFKGLKCQTAYAVVIALTSSIIVSCSSGSSGAGVERATGVSDAISSGATKIKEGLPGGGTRGLSRLVKSKGGSDVTIASADLNSTQFTTADLTGISANFNSPKTYLQYLIDESPEDTPSNGMGIFQRYRQKVMQSMCAFTALLPDTNSDGIPDVGTHSVTIPATISTELAAKCPEASSGMFSTVAGETVSAVVTDVSAISGTNYDVKGVMTGASGVINGQSLGQFYFRSTSGLTRFMFLEVGNSLSLYENSGGLIKFEYIAPSSQRMHFRYVMNETTGDTAFYGYEKNASSPNELYATGVSNTGNSTQAAFAITADTSGTDYTDARACIQPTDALTHLGTWAAACTSITGVGLATTPTIVTNLSGLSLTEGNYNQEDEIQFTSPTDIVSAGFPQ